MKATKIYTICILCSLLYVLAGCHKQNSFDVSGDCRIEALELDNQYVGKIDHTAREVIVAVPEVHEDHQMKLTKLTLSAGAMADVAEGTMLNLTSPVVIQVKNGNVFQEYKVSVKHDEAVITSFVLNGEYIGIIDQTARTIAVAVPVGTDLKTLVPTVKMTEGATLSPAAGMPCDFTESVDFTVSYNTARTTYRVTVTEKGNPVVLYLGLAETVGQLNEEEQAAVTWMLSNVTGSDYASFSSFAAGRVNMSECKVIWWHLHKDGGLEGKAAFEANAPDAVTYACLDRLKDFYQAGGSFLLTRYATNLTAYLGEADVIPNNCWGQNEDAAETISEPWSFSIAGHTDHALWQNLTMDPTKSDQVFTCDAGYRITNSTAQYHIGTDWGGYDNREVFRTKTGAVDIAGGDDAVVAWEYLRTADHGAIVCIGSGCYDWYTVAEGVTEYYHNNVAKITQNAFDYLKN